MADSKLGRTERNMVIVEKLKKLEDDQTGLVAVMYEMHSQPGGSPRSSSAKAVEAAG